jgi:hypothetical protein
MDMQTPDHADRFPADRAAPPSRQFCRHLRQSVAAAVPSGSSDSEAALEDKRQAARELFDYLNPGNPADAHLAAIAVASAQSAMDNFARAARPGMSDDTVTRLRGSGLAAGRAYAAWARLLCNRRSAAQQPQPPAAAAPRRDRRRRPPNRRAKPRRCRRASSRFGQAPSRSLPSRCSSPATGSAGRFRAPAPT